MISSQGTDIGNAIELCMSSFSEDRTNKAVVIISDGEDHEEMAIEAAEMQVKMEQLSVLLVWGQKKEYLFPLLEMEEKLV